MTPTEALAAFEEHDWECREDPPALQNVYWWKVYRDGVYVGLLRATDSQFLNADQFYNAFDDEGTPITTRPYDGPSTYTNALVALNAVLDGGAASMNDDEQLSADDIRRELEAQGLTSGVDRTEVTEAMRNAYSEVWEPSRKLQQDHENALKHSLAAALRVMKTFGL